MNFINRAIKNVTRKLPKTILLGLTFFLIGNLVIVGLGVSNASKQAKILTRQKMRAVATVSIDYEKVWQYVDSLEDEDAQNEFYKNYPSVTLGDVNELLEDERVKTANATSINMCYFPDNSSLEYVHLNNDAESNMGVNSQSCYFDENGKEVCTTYLEPYVSLKANYFPSMIELEEGKYVVTEGRFYTKQDIEEGNNVVLITEEFAQLNGLSVGDTITLDLMGYSNNNEFSKLGISREELYKDLEIIGIYSHTDHITPDSSSYEWTYPYENPDNVMLCPGTTYTYLTIEVQQKLWDYYMEIYPDDTWYSDPDNYPTIESIDKTEVYDTTLLLNDPLDVDGFIDDYKDNLGEFITVGANNDEFNRLAKPLDTLSLYANFIVYLVVINAIVIITLVTALTLKTREYEIGVLLSIGASKLKIIAQFFIELALVAVIGFTVAVGSGSLIANKVGATVLDYQIQESGVGEDEGYYIDNYISIWDTDYSTDVTLDDLISEYNVSVSPLIIGEIYVVGLIIVGISIIIPSLMIMRFNPKKILMNQN